MEVKVNFDDDFGFTTVEHVSPEQRTAHETSRLTRVWDMIRPFLDNLMKDPERDIHWPDRDKKIAAFKKRLEDVIFEKP